MSNTLYDQDFFAWATEQARLLRAGRLSELVSQWERRDRQPWGASLKLLSPVERHGIGAVA